jgi:hypothetical protein
VTLAAVGGTWAASGQTLTLTVTSASVGWADVTGKPSFATVATSGSYNDLADTPSPYSLPTATESVLGGVKIGSGISIDGNGVISASSAYTLPTATANTLGGVKIGSGVTITDGVISVSTAYAATSHTHTASEVTDFSTAALAAVTWSTLTGKPSFATVATSGSYADLGNVPSTFTPAAHNQAWSTITSTPTTLSGYGITDAVASNDARLTDSRTPTAHKTSHATGGSDALTASDIGAAAASHTHAISDVTSLQTSLDAKVASITTGITGADAITNIVSLTQAEYDAISVKNASTLYIIT